MTNAKIAKQTDLFKSMQLLRLQNDMKLVNEKLEKNRSTPVRSDDNFVKRFFDSRKNDIKDYIKDKEIKEKTCLVGPHRDDLAFKINGISVRDFASQGQKRSIALSLKLAEAEIIKEKLNKQPVILLDDVMSELDALRQDYILNHIKDRQVFITCCEPGSILRMSEGKTFSIKEGGLS